MIWQYATIVLAILVPAFAFRKKALTPSAAVLAALMILVALLAGPNYAAFLITSFLLITVIDKVCKKKTQKAEENITQKTGTRDVIQVFVNGGISMLSVLLWYFSGDRIFLLCFISALVESFGDSSASNIGIATGQQTYDICRFQRITNGLSGGVTMGGTLGCLMACVMMSALAFVLKTITTTREMTLVMIAGFLGCMLDSILGSLVQRKNRCSVCGTITEKKIHCNNATEYYSGIRVINNDCVNFICNLFSAIVIYALVKFSGIQLLHILLTIIVAVFICTISTAAHEFAHLIMCKILKCRVIDLKVPFFQFKESRWSVQTEGRNHCSFAASSDAKMKAIVVAGPLIELIVSVGCLLAANVVQTGWIKAGFFAGAALIVISVAYDLLPITGGDGKLLFSKEDN